MLDVRPTRFRCGFADRVIDRHTPPALALLAAITTFLATAPSHAAEVTALSSSNVKTWLPIGKEVDAIYGDYVIRNKHIVAVIAQTKATRHANLTVHNIGGCLIDLTERMRARQSDQLSAYYPGGGRFRFTAAKVLVDGKAIELDGKQAVTGKTITIEVSNPGQSSLPQLTTRYTISDQPSILIESTYYNPSDSATKATLMDSLRTDGARRWGMTTPFPTASGEAESKEPSTVGMLWIDFQYWRQCYGFESLSGKLAVRATAPKGRIPNAFYHELNGKRTVQLKPKASVTTRTRVTPARDMLALRGVGGGEAGFCVALGEGWEKEHNVEATLLRAGKAVGRAWLDGGCNHRIPAGDYELRIDSSVHAAQSLKFTVKPGETFRKAIAPGAPAMLKVNITDGEGKPIPSKTQFIGVDGTKDPYWFDNTGEHNVQNLVYNASGSYTQAVRPGKYRLVFSYGPEYDYAEETVTLESGKTTSLSIKLKRSVDTTGYLSAEYHSHSSPSGDNVSSQRGRVLNLLCEHIEFAPCTEHQRIDSYTPHLEALKAVDLMLTCPGMELTGRPLPLNHQNAFPMQHKPYTQDGGGPTTDRDPIVQIKRLAMWGNGKKKLVQQDHPNIVQHAFDKNLDGKFDGGYSAMIEHMDAIEVHPPQHIFSKPALSKGVNTGRNRMHSWLLMLNAGYRVPGVVNTDAHYNHHGSGWFRNYVASKSDDPAKATVSDLVTATKNGHVVMSTGPFMTVAAHWNNPKAFVVPTPPGGELAAKDGKVAMRIKVQCPNWLDINRVQVFVNGVPDKRMNYTRQDNANLFKDGVVKFEAFVKVALTQDAHLIVAAIGEGMDLQPVYPTKLPPIAVSNPIFVDVDEKKGWQPNFDALGTKTPLRSGE